MKATPPRSPRWRPPPHPSIYEINTWPWLARLSQAEGRPVDLATVPDRCWDDLSGAGYDAVWLMGVWQRSPAGRALALSDPALVASFDAALPGFEPRDVVGSPYCIRGYVVDPHLGGEAGLAAARDALSRRGLGLICDFVPNHLAPDHPWTTDHPDRFVQGTLDDVRQDPASFVVVSGRVLANGRDPYFPAWPDVVQLDASSPEVRRAAVATLRDVAERCDGVRCDMAMLVMNDTFARTWGERVGEPPAEDYWPTVIDAVRATHPGFVFIAEAYWDLERALQEQGFDLCYDKRLYDRLLHGDVEQVRRHLLADASYQAGLLRFVENHDEPRLASLVDPAREQATVVAALTQAGGRLVHHGQVEGWKVRLPVFLGRYPDEATDDRLAAFHRSLLSALSDPTFRHGRWRPCEVAAEPGDDPAGTVAWCWDGERRWVVVVNLGDTPSAGRVRVPWPELRGRPCHLVDHTTGTSHDHDGSTLGDGLPVRLDPWGWHLWRVECPPRDG